MATPACSIGLVRFKLIEKLAYKGHVYFEPVRPDVIRLLDSLKANNHLYKDISIASDNFPTNLICEETPGDVIAVIVTAPGSIPENLIAEETPGDDVIL